MKPLNQAEKVKNPNNMVLLVLFLGVLMGALDIAIVGPALTPIRKWFGVTVRDMTWVFSVYVLMNLVATPILAKLSDISGRKSVYIASVLFFATGSLVVAFSPSFAFAVLGRAIQGFGAGGIFPVASAVIGDTFPPEKRGSALGLIGAVFGIAFIIGPVVGGLLLMAGWKWIFLVNIPIAALLVFLAARILPRSEKKETARFDWVGTLLVSLTLAGFVYGINRIDTTRFFSSLASLSVAPWLLASVALLIGVLFVEKRAANPLISPVLFGKRQLNLTHFLAFGAGFAEASLVFIPALAIAGFSVSSSTSSFLLLPLVFAMAISSPLFGRMLDKMGAKPVILFGTAALASGMILLGLYQSNWVIFYLATVLIGFGLAGLLGAPIRYILLGEVDAAHRSSAQGDHDRVHQFGAAGQRRHHRCRHRQRWQCPPGVWKSVSGHWGIFTAAAGGSGSFEKHIRTKTRTDAER
jgi:EmrB/QacA subfamily drug resistance transporter